MTKTNSTAHEAKSRGTRAMLLLVFLAAAAIGLNFLLAGRSAGPDRSSDPGWVNAQQSYLASLSSEDGWRELEGGLRWRVVETAGSERKPAVQDRVSVHYEGSLIDGEVFDSSYVRGEPATFRLGSVIKAWQMAIPQMSVGDTIEIATPADLGYGPRGKGPIPGGATLLFKVQLLGIEEAQ